MLNEAQVIGIIACVIFALIVLPLFLKLDKYTKDKYKE